MPKFEMNEGRFRFVDVLNQVVDYLQFVARAFIGRSSLVFGVNRSPRHLAHYCVPQVNRIECISDVGDDIC